jgi:hypothetical protein
LEKISIPYILKNIWFRPSKVLKLIIASKNRDNVYVLLFLGGIAYSFYKAINRGELGFSSIYHMVIFRGILGGLLGWLVFYIFTSLLSFTGEWIGGKAEGDQYRTVLAWSMIPAIVGLFLLIPGYMIFGEGLFSNTQEIYQFEYISFYSGFKILYFILNVWSVIIFIKGIKIIQNFSTLRAIGNLFLPSLALAAVFLILLFTFNLIN